MDSFSAMETIVKILGVVTVASDLVSNAEIQVNMNLWTKNGQSVRLATIRILQFHYNQIQRRASV